ncbi:hypothetical protein M0P65_05470 [Candidatus Gracilibacteria bacterium]|nr:hypothetical protein [Candidatus Gracilibacteria bacterium]
MIGYKATCEGKCKDQLYEVGKTYTLDGKMKICERGFHFCQDLYDVFYYYPENKDTKVFKVEALGEIKTKSDKSVTNKIKILEEVSLSNMIVEKKGYKKFFDYKGNFIKFEDSDGHWVAYKYNKNRNIIRREHSNGNWVKYKYNKNNKVIKRECSNGDWEKYYYDKKTLLIKTKYGRTINVIKDN